MDKGNVFSIKVSIELLGSQVRCAYRRRKTSRTEVAKYIYFIKQTKLHFSHYSTMKSESTEKSLLFMHQVCNFPKLKVDKVSFKESNIEY